MTEAGITHRALNAEEHAAMTEALQLADHLVGHDTPLDFAQVQGLYDQLLAQDAPDDDHVIALGIAFGAAINARAGFDWVRVTNQWGDETCVGPAHKTIHCAPISMVQKRLQRSEAIDLEQLANVVIRAIRTNIAEGKAGDW